MTSRFLVEPCDKLRGSFSRFSSRDPVILGRRLKDCFLLALAEQFTFFAERISQSFYNVLASLPLGLFPNPGGPTLAKRFIPVPQLCITFFDPLIILYISCAPFTEPYIP